LQAENALPPPTGAGGGWGLDPSDRAAGKVGRAAAPDVLAQALTHRRPGSNPRLGGWRRSRSGRCTNWAENRACRDGAGCPARRVVRSASGRSLARSDEAGGPGTAPPDVASKPSARAIGSTGGGTAKESRPGPTSGSRTRPTARRSTGPGTCGTGASGTATARPPKSVSERGATTSGTATRSSPRPGSGACARSGPRGRVLTEGSPKFTAPPTVIGSNGASLGAEDRAPVATDPSAAPGLARDGTGPGDPAGASLLPQPQSRR